VTPPSPTLVGLGPTSYDDTARPRAAGSRYRHDAWSDLLGAAGTRRPVLQTEGFDGHIYGLPRTHETMTLFYNETLFDKNAWQPPKTLAELQALAAAMMQKGITPFGADRR